VSVKKITLQNVAKLKCASVLIVLVREFKANAQGLVIVQVVIVLKTPQLVGNHNANVSSVVVNEEMESVWEIVTAQVAIVEQTKKV